MNPAVDAIVVTYNSEQHIAGCLRALRKALRSRGSIFVVDNASVDATLAEVDSVAMFAADVHVDARPDNLGFGAAVNIASARTDAGYILLVNPDVELEGDAVDALLALAGNFPDVGLYGGRATSPDGTIDPTTCLAVPTLWSAVAFGLGLSAVRFLPNLDPESLGGWRRDSVRSVPALAGTVLLLDARLWRELGGFDETFFLYGEDVDLCSRAADRGHTAMFSPSVRYTHAAGASSGPVRRMELILTGRMTLYGRVLDARAARRGLVRATRRRAARPRRDAAPPSGCERGGLGQRLAHAERLEARLVALTTRPPNRQPLVARGEKQLGLPARDSGYPRSASHPRGPGVADDRAIRSTSPRGTRTMDAIALLKADHKAVSKLFREYKAAKKKDSAGRAKFVDNAIKELSIHAAIEEQVFYPAVRAEVPKLEDDILESLEEHHVLKWTLEEISSIGVGDERYDAKVTVMMEQVRHHVEEEETDWFPKVRDAMSRTRLQELGAALEKAKKKAPRTPEPDRVVPR